MGYTKTTELDSNYNHLEKMSSSELLTYINNEDKIILQEIIKLINVRDNKFKNMDLVSNDINLIDPSRWSL